MIQAGSLILHRHRDPARHHYIIQISPAIEGFILENAAAVAVSLEEYGLPSDFDRLKKVAKQKNSKEDPDFRKLFRAIYQGGAPGFRMLADWVECLKEQTYQVDIEALKARSLG